MTPHQSSNWEHLAEQASKETDPAKMMLFIAQLCHALDIDHAQKIALQRIPEPNLFRAVA